MTHHRLQWTPLSLAVLLGVVSIPFWVILVLALWGALCPARAHDSWISNGSYRNAAGEWCCGKDDCGVLTDGKVAAIVGGFDVDADFTIERPGQPSLVEHVREFVPYSEALPSPDGQFWRCRTDGKRRCFFAGKPSS